DLGTGGIRCIVVNEEGLVLTEVTRSLSRLNLSANPGESEQDAKEWISILESALDELFAEPKNRHILAVAVDSTSGTVLPVGPNTEPLGPALLHNDMRSVEE
ncbi:MAG: FGGY family carbohydrate kinase, partial [Opitutae bacterium]